MDIEKAREDFIKSKKYCECSTLEEKKRRVDINILYWSWVENNTENTEYWRGVYRGLEDAEKLVMS